MDYIIKVGKGVNVEEIKFKVYQSKLHKSFLLIE